MVRDKGRVPFGIDEAGTGAIAGPIIAAAVWLAPKFDEREELSNQKLSIGGQNVTLKLHDSKLLSAAERSALFAGLRGSSNLKWATASVPASHIDEFGIVASNSEAMRLAISRLRRKLQPCPVLPGTQQYWCLVDGDALPKFLPAAFEEDEDGLISEAKLDSGPLREFARKGPRLYSLENGPFCGIAVPSGDKTELCIAAASLFAKVARDSAMKSAHRRHPHWNFDEHKGYGTRAHLERVASKGACESLHRMSVSPFVRRKGQRVAVASTRKLYERIQIRLQDKRGPYSREIPTRTRLETASGADLNLKSSSTEFSLKSKKAKRRKRGGKRNY